MENDQKIVFKFSKINTRIKLIVLWVCLIILYNHTNISYRFLEVLRDNPIAEKMYRYIYLERQNAINQIIFDNIDGKEINRTKLIIFDILNSLFQPQLTFFLMEMIITLVPVLMIMANIFIKKYIINKINIIAGIFYILICILIIIHGYSIYSTNSIYTSYTIMCIVEIFILLLIIMKSIQWFKIIEE